MITTKEYLTEIDTSLEKLKDDFNKQMAAISDEKNRFHNTIIDLTAKYPEHKDLIQFTVLVNDNLETRQEHYSDLITTSFNESILAKKKLIKAIQPKNYNKKKPLGFWKNLITDSKMFGDLKLVLMSTAVILFIILIFLKPGIVVTVLKSIASLL